MSLPERRRLHPALLVIPGLWLFAWLWLTRYHQLDDALIFMRYAEQLEAHRALTFDGSGQSWGVSSLGFLGLTVALHLLTGWTLSAKLASVLACLTSLAIVARQLLRTRPPEQLVWGALGLILLSPMGLRWTTDGMDTSLVSAFTLALSLAAWNVAVSPTRSVGRYLLLVSLGMVAVWVRVEFAMMIFFAAVACWLYSLEAAAAESGRRPALSQAVATALRESHFAIGGLIGLGLIYLALGGFVAETAAAKLTAPKGIASSAYRMLLSCVSSFSLGLGSLGLWAVSALLAGRVAFRERRGRASFLVMNSALLFLVVLIGVRGQNVQGIRHILWVFFLMIPWNARMLSLAPDVTLTWLRELSPSGSARRVLSTGLIVGFVGLWTFETTLVWRIAAIRSKAFLAMQRDGLDAFSDQLGIAFDVGFVSYFTGARICDLNGLVNGAEHAKRSRPERAAHCASLEPGFAFVRSNQTKFLSKNGYPDIGEWSICRQYAVRSPFQTPVYYLLLRPSLAVQPAARVCTGDGRTARELLDS